MNVVAIRSDIRLVIIIIPSLRKRGIKLGHTLVEPGDDTGVCTVESRS